MIEYKDGILKLNFSQDILDVIWNVSFFLLMLSVICFGATNNVTNYYYYTTFFVFIGISLFEAIVRKKISLNIWIPLHTVWYGLFMILGLVSSIWAESFSPSIGILTKLLQIIAVTYCLILHIDSNERLERYIDDVLAASIFLVVYIFVRTPVDSWFSGFLGRVTNYNSNDIGCALTIAVIFAFYKAFIRNKKIMYFVALLCFFAVILTSSRKSLAMSILGVVMIATFNYRSKNYLLRVFTIIGILIFAIFMIYEIPMLYNTVGVRIDSMLEYLMNDKSADSSMSLRQYYIDMAVMFYLENPVLGIGLNNFIYRVGLYGERASYAHNNYCEIAACLGTVGIVVYYWFYAYLAMKLVKQLLNGYKTALLFMPLMILFIVFEYGMVNYYKMQVHLVIAAAFVAVCLNDREEMQKQELTEMSV